MDNEEQKYALSQIPQYLIETSTVEQEKRMIEQLSNAGNRVEVKSVARKITIKKNGDVQISGGEITIIVTSKVIADYQLATNKMIRELKLEFAKSSIELENQRSLAIRKIYEKFDKDKAEKMNQLAYEIDKIKISTRKSQEELEKQTNNEMNKQLQIYKNLDLDLKEKLRRHQEKYEESIRENRDRISNATEDFRKKMKEKEKEIIGKKEIESNKLSHEHNDLNNYINELNQEIQVAKNKLIRTINC